MFTLGAIALMGLLIWGANRGDKKDRSMYEGSDSNWLLALHIRQDLKLVLYFLAGIMFMLGIIADLVIAR